MLALVDGARISAVPGLRGLCPSCDNRVLSKCGSINIWHWAHIASADCDTWREEETPWHREWKGRFPIDSVEVVLENHRADVHLQPTKTTIEFQHSPISPEEIFQRELFYGFYGPLWWVFDLADTGDRFTFTKRETYHTFRWRHPRRSILTASSPSLWDFGMRGLFHPRKIYHDPCAGWGTFINRNEWITNLSWFQTFKAVQG